MENMLSLVVGVAEVVCSMGIGAGAAAYCALARGDRAAEDLSRRSLSTGRIGSRVLGDKCSGICVGGEGKLLVMSPSSEGPEVSEAKAECGVFAEADSRFWERLNPPPVV
jgi:hypothetical protein